MRGEAIIQVVIEQIQTELTKSTEFVTPGRPLVLERSLDQPDAGGECYVPLDTAWGMVGQFATPEVREAVLFAVAPLTPREVEALVAKCAPFHPSAAAIHTMTQQMGEWLEAHPELPTQIRAEEDMPEGTRVLVASLDGVNVLLAEREGQARATREAAARPQEG